MLDLRIDKGGSGSGGSGGDVDIAQSTGSSTTKVMSQKAVSDRILYTNSDPVPTALGGVKAGETFNKIPVNDLFTKLLYPYQVPTINSFKIDNLTSKVLEVGETYPSGNKTFTWTTTNSDNIKPNSITLNSEVNLPNNGSRVQMVNDITKTTATNHTFTISAKDTTDKTISKTITFNWQYRMYFGVSLNPDITDSELLAMPSGLATSRSKTYDHMCSAGEHIYIAYPSSFGDMNNIRISNQVWNDYVLVKRNVVNAFGVSIPFNIYRSVNIYFGKVSVVWN